MIKINGLNYKKGDGDSYTFGNPCNRNGDGTGDGIIIHNFYCFSNGDGFGDGEYFGSSGNGNSYFSSKLKKEFTK